MQHNHSQHNKKRKVLYFKKVVNLNPAYEDTTAKPKTNRRYGKFLVSLTPGNCLEAFTK